MYNQNIITMKTKIKFLLTLMLVTSVSVSLLSCGGDDDGDSINEEINNPSNNSYSLGPEDALFQYIIGTWKVSSLKEYDEYGNFKSNLNSGDIITFLPELYEGSNFMYQAQYNGESYFRLSDYKSYYSWYIKRPDYIVVSHGICSGTIFDVSPNCFSVKEEKSSGSYRIHTMERVSDNYSDEISGHAPEFTNFNFTATQTSVTVKFMTDVKATSATIKYGNSSPTTSVGADISNKQISVTIRDLKRGTKYYVNCTAKNSYGSTTSATYPVTTNY